MEHTPGPWGQGEFSHSITDDVEGNDHPSGGTLATVYNPYEPWSTENPELYAKGEEIQEANLNLMCAAPDMLEALQIFQEVVSKQNDVFRANYGSAFDTALGIANEAVKKARKKNE